MFKYRYIYLKTRINWIFKRFLKTKIIVFLKKHINFFLKNLKKKTTKIYNFFYNIEYANIFRKIYKNIRYYLIFYVSIIKNRKFIIIWKFYFYKVKKIYKRFVKASVFKFFYEEEWYFKLVAAQNIFYLKFCWVFYFLIFENYAEFVSRKGTYTTVWYTDEYWEN